MRRDAPGGRRRKHADPLRPVRRRRRWSSTGVSRPCASRPPTSSAPRSATCCAARLRFADVDASIVSSTVPQLEPEWSRPPQRYLGHECLVVGPGTKTGLRDPRRQPARDRRRPARQRRRDPRAFDGAAVGVDFGTATTFDVVSARRRVPRRRAAARHRDLARGARRSRRAAAAGRTRPPRGVIGEKHDRRDPLRGRVRLRRGDRRDRCGALNDELAERRSRRDGRPRRRSSCPTPRRSTRSTRCSR